MKNRLDWVVFLKFLGIFFVILGHISSPFSEFIYAWHMPLFFMVSGFFISSKAPLHTLVIKDFNRLMLPYFIFSFVALVVTIVKLKFMGRPPLDILSEVVSILYWMDYKHLNNTYAFVLWFLPALFFGRMLYYFICNFFVSKITQFVLAIAFLGLSLKVELPLGISNGLNCLIWIFIGNFIYFNVALNDFRKIEVFLIVIFLVMILFYTYAMVGLPGLDMSSLNYSNVFFNFVWAISFFILLVFLSKSYFNEIKGSALVNKWGEGTMLLFIFHPYSNNFAHLAAQKMGLDFWFVKLFITLALLHFLILIKERYSNWLIFKYV